MTESFHTGEYISKAIANIITSTILAVRKNPKEFAFLLKYLPISKRAESIRASHEKADQHIPPFLIASITTRCNLFCSGCYARANQLCHDQAASGLLSSDDWNRIFLQARDLGISFILLAGGEPLLRRDVLLVAATYKEIIFPVFTNGTGFDEAFFSLFDNNRNLIPMISIEGSAEQTNRRRGEGVYAKIDAAMHTLCEKGILFGVSITVTKSNIREITQLEFLRTLFELGAKVVLYVEYVPVTADTTADAPDDQDRSFLEERIQSARKEHRDMLFLSFPGDEKHTGGCLAAGRGFFHINPAGGAEPCPFSPFSDTNVRTQSLIEVLHSPLFAKLSADGMLLGEHSGGCLLFEKENEVREMMKNL